MPCQQFRYWILTIPADEFLLPSPLPDYITYCAGQREVGANTGYEHYQVVVYFAKKTTLSRLKQVLTSNGRYSEEEYMQSPLAQKRPKIMSSKMTQLSQEHDLTWDHYPSSEIERQIGIWYDKMQSRGHSLKFPLTFTFNIIGLSRQSLVIMLNHKLLKEMQMYFGAELVQVSLKEPGKKLEKTLMLKTPALNGGMDIMAKRMLSSMNSVGLLEYLTYYVGLTGTLFELKLKEEVVHLMPPDFGLRQMLILANGIQS